MLRGRVCSASLDLQLDFDRFFDLFPDDDQRRMSFRRRRPRTRDPARHPPLLVPSRPGEPASHPRGRQGCQGVRLALVGATHPQNEVTCEIRHGSAYETRRSDGSITVVVLQPRVDSRDPSWRGCCPTKAPGPDPMLTDPQSLAFWGRGIGGEWELVIPDHEFDRGPGPHGTHRGPGLDRLSVPSLNQARAEDGVLHLGDEGSSRALDRAACSIVR